MTNERLHEFITGLGKGFASLKPATRPAGIAIGSLLLATLTAFALIHGELPTAAALSLLLGALVGGYYMIKAWIMLIRAQMEK